jgi:D-psicose/D-tagatose/L-ribulose 3-epimerase
VKFGMNMLLWSTDVTGEDYLPLFEKLKAMGFDGVELPIFDARPDRFAELGRRLDDIGLERTGVTVRGADDDPGSTDPAVRQAGIDNTKAAAECCEAGGMDLLAGPFYAGLGVFTGQGPTEDEWARGVETMRDVAEHASGHGVTLALEALNRFEIYLLNTAADTARFVREVDHPNCRMMIDTFHAHIEEKDVAEAVHSCADVLVHVQVAENDRSTPGSGQVRWEETFRALKGVGYDGWLAIEAFGLGLPELARATSIWRRMFETEEQLAADGLAFLRRSWDAVEATEAASR